MVVFEGVEMTRYQGRLLLLYATKKGCDDFRGIASLKIYDIDVVDIETIVVGAAPIRYQ